MGEPVDPEHLDIGLLALFTGLAGRQQVWMSHRDVVGRVPEGFSVAGRTDTCEIAAIADPSVRTELVSMPESKVARELA